MNKKQSIGRLGIKLVIMTFVLSSILGSCKKEHYNAEKIDPTRKKEMLGFKNGPKIDVINFDQFKNKVNLNALGSLKQEFVNTSPTKSNLMSIRTAETYLGFKIITDSIKVIKANGHTMYVFPVVLSSKRAVSFQNLTIDESSAGTLAFVNTYTPTKKWIADYKKGHAGKFEGDVSVKYLNLNNGNTSNNQSISNKKNGQSTIAVAQNCTSTTYFFEIPYPCASGQHNPWESGCELVGDESAGYALFEAVITQCTDIPEPVGGGGGTTPNPPPNYEPCPDEPGELPTVSGKKPMGNRMLVVPPPTEWDSVDVPVEIINNVQDPCLKNTVASVLNNNITGAIKDIIKNLDKDITVKIKIFDATTTTHGGSGETTNTIWERDPTTGNVLSFSSNITLSKDVLLTSSKEFTTSVIIHEILHAYFRETTGKMEEFNGLDHQTIAITYIAPMASFISSLYGITLSDAMALSWDGLSETKAYKDNVIADSFKIGSGSDAVTLSKQDVLDTIRDYTLKTNGKGKSLCQ